MIWIPENTKKHVLSSRIMLPDKQVRVDIVPAGSTRAAGSEAVSPLPPQGEGVVPISLF